MDIINSIRKIVTAIGAKVLVISWLDPIEDAKLIAKRKGECFGDEQQPPCEYNKKDFCKICTCNLEEKIMALTNLSSKAYSGAGGIVPTFCPKAKWEGDEIVQAIIDKYYDGQYPYNS